MASLSIAERPESNTVFEVADSNALRVLALLETV